jgi:nicotinamidase-related amidase
MSKSEFDPMTTALVAIDLQHGVVALKTAPHEAADVVSRTKRIADAIRTRGGTVFWVRVATSPDGRDALSPIVDAAAPPATQRAQNWSQLVPELGAQEGDVIITKRQWGAFYGTDLELHLRRRGIRTVILTGIATHIGVESTARDAYERGFDQIFVEDATASPSEDAHRATFKFIFPRIGRIRSTEQVLGELG